METAIKSNGRLTDQWVASLAAEEQGDYRTALDIHREILRQENASYASSLRAGWLYYVQGSFEEALRYYERACALSSDEWPLYGIMNCLRALGDQDALAVVSKALCTAP
ncbi:tetratricopeptide repeat protein [Pontiella sp.]|uniref:tetratricopeptide repeat protein n=1 Tax=Pontiella sp. TaxID=2837462 RepID=UPI0035629EA4